MTNPFFSAHISNKCLDSTIFQMRDAMCSFFVKCLFYYFKIFGVAPVSNCYFDSSIPFAASRSGLLYNLLLACPVVGTSYFALKHSLLNECAQRVAFEKIVDTIHTFFDIFTALFILTVFCVYQKRVADIANRLYAIFKLSTCLTTHMDHQVDEIGPDIYITRVKKILILVSTISIFWFITIFLNQHIDFIYYFGIMTFNNVIIMSILLQYSLVLKLLQYLYQWVNADLTSVLKLANNDNFQKTTIKLTQLHEIHMNLSRLSRDVSLFYALPMLICFSNSFLTMIIYGYYIVKSFMALISLPTAIILHCVMVVVINLVLVTILSRAAGVTVRESKATGEIVSESISTCQNERVLKQLKDISIYLLHKYTGFCVYSLFPLNETLVISILSSLTTYLIILIQFKESSQD